MNDELQYDEDLWFFHKGCTGKHFLLGNPHTFSGRMSAWCPVNQRSFAVSKSEIEEQSEPSKYWIQGFLHGNQPEPPVNEEGDVEVESMAFQKWAAASVLFTETGYWWSGEPRHCATCRQELLAAEPAEICSNCRDKAQL